MALEKELTLIVLTSFIFDSATETFSHICARRASGQSRKGSRFSVWKDKHSGLVALMDTCELESGIEKETTEAVQI